MADAMACAVQLPAAVLAGRSGMRHNPCRRRFGHHKVPKSPFGAALCNRRLPSSVQSPQRVAIGEFHPGGFEGGKGVEADSEPDEAIPCSDRRVWPRKRDNSVGGFNHGFVCMSYQANC